MSKPNPPHTPDRFRLPSVFDRGVTIRFLPFEPTRLTLEEVRRLQKPIPCVLCEMGVPRVDQNGRRVP